MFVVRCRTAWIAWPLANLSSRARELAKTCCQPRVLAIALVLLGAAARLRQYFAVTSYWHDEAFLLLNVFEKSFWQLIGPLSHDQAAPPLFLWVLRACYLALGPSELAMRLPALLASLAALLLMVPLARTVVATNGWLWAVGCASVSSCLLHLTYQVKPYTTDVLIAEAILLASAIYLDTDVPRNQRLASGSGLLVATLLAPWLSFPSVFILAGAGIALLFNAARTGGQARWAFFAAMQAALLASCAGLWLIAARHHNTPYQQSFWAADFVDLSSVGACLNWLGSKLIEAGDYGVQGTGLPVAVLALVGLANYARRSPHIAIMLAAPVCLACVAAALRHYPLGNRLLAFLLPSLWLAAAEGVSVLSCILRRRADWAVPAVAVLILLAGAVRTALYTVVAKPSVEFRQAFEYIHRNWRAGDSLWVSQPAVYAAYFGRQANVIDGDSPREAVMEAARRGRIWMVCHPPSTETTRWDSARACMESSGALNIDHRRFVHLDLRVFSAPLVAQNKSADTWSNWPKSYGDGSSYSSSGSSTGVP
jgi:hypothetical protein